MRAVKTLGLAVAAAVAIASLSEAQSAVSIRLATFAPANSFWHKALVEMGQSWTQATSGRLKLTVYPGGTQGTESTVVRMMRPGIDQLQGALLLLPGLSEIDEACNAFAMPFFFRSDAEFEAVLAKAAPVLSKRLEAKGFHVINWGSAGWVQLFSKREIRTLNDLKQAKLYTTEGDDRMVRWYQANGFRPVALSFNDIPAQLKLPNGMVDAVPSPAYGALALQFFRDAPFMLEVRVAPLLGATVVSTAVWNKVSPEDRARMLEAGAVMQKQVFVSAPRLDTESVTAMSARGLKVTKLDPSALAEFNKAADAMVASQRGTMVPADVFDLVRDARDGYRKSSGQ